MEDPKAVQERHSTVRRLAVWKEVPLLPQDWPDPTNWPRRC